MWCVVIFFFFFKQKTAYEMRISDWSSDVCSSDLDRSQPREEPGVLRVDAGVDQPRGLFGQADAFVLGRFLGAARLQGRGGSRESARQGRRSAAHGRVARPVPRGSLCVDPCGDTGARHRLHPRCRRAWRSEEHTSELQSLMRISYAVFCLKKKKQT